MHTNATDERRGSFRVDMTARIAINPSPGETVDASDCFPELHAMSLLAQSHTLDHEIALFNDRIKDLSVKKTLDLLNQKLNLIAKLIDLQTATTNGLETQVINVSEGGCALNSPEKASVNQRVALALIFTPHYFALFCFADVREVEPVDHGYRYHLSFSGITETERQGLLKHMFQAQTDARKRADTN